MIFGLIKRKYAVPFHLANGGIEFKKETVGGDGEQELRPIQKRRRLRAKRSD